VFWWGSSLVWRNKPPARAGAVVARAQLISNRDGFAFLQMLNVGYLEMTKSWICNVKRFPGVLNKTVFIATDQAAYDGLMQWDPTLQVFLEEFAADPSTIRYGRIQYIHATVATTPYLGLAVLM
jgi:hypothetical protein